MMRMQKRLMTTLVCVLVGAFAVGSHGGMVAEPGLDEAVGDQDGIQRFVLGNGLELVVVPSVSQEHTDVQAWLIVRAGSMDELDDQRGSAKVYERLIREGTQSFSSEVIDDLLSTLDGSSASEDVKLSRRRSGSFVSFDHAAYMAQVDLENLEQLNEVFGLYREILDIDSSGFSRLRVEQAVDVLIEQVNTQRDPELRARQRWLPELMKGTHFGERLPTPDLESLRSLKASAVEEFARAKYRPGQATVLVVGDVDGAAIETMVIKAMVINSMGALAKSEGDNQFDGRLKCDVSMRSAVGSDEAFETHQAAMVWFSDLDNGADRAWSKRAQDYRYGEMRDVVISRLAGEIVRHRLSRLITQELGEPSEISVEQFELFGQVGVVQIGIKSQTESWDRAMRFLVHECDRLSRDGAGGDELSRARRSVLARWHRQGDDWIGSDNRQRMGLVHWQLTTGRPIMDMVRWDKLATEMMSGIRDDEINLALGGLVEPRRASYVALVPESESEGLDARAVLGVVQGAIGTPIGEIHPNWMELLGGSLIDDELVGGKMREISGHDESGVWTVALDNGVRVHTRAMGDAQPGGDERVYLHVTLWGSMFTDRMIDDDHLSAAMSAWREPASESRSRGAISVYMNEHELKLRVDRQIGYVQIQIDGPSRSVRQMMELAFVMLDRPMIEGEVFEAWKKRHADANPDPLDDAMELLYPSPISEIGQHAEPTLEGTQRLLTQIVRNARIDVGVAGAVDVDDVIEESRRIFGSLVERGGEAQSPKVAAHDASKIQCDRVIQVVCEQKSELGFVLGFVSDPDQKLKELRSLILTSMVLNERLAALNTEEGFEGTIYSTIAYTDATPGQMVFLIRAWCEEGQIEKARELVYRAVGEMAEQGVGDDLVLKQGKLAKSISKYFSTPGYWSRRLGMLGVHGWRVNDLWTIREGYSEINAQFANEVFEALVAGDERFEIEIVESR